MIEKITDALRLENIENWIISEHNVHSAEIFMIKKAEDMRRSKDVSSVSVTVFNDFEADGKKMRGSAGIIVYPGTEAAELRAKLRTAYISASYVKNPYYELPSCTKQALAYSGDTRDLFVIAEEMLSALYEPDNTGESFINSAEIFASRTGVRTLTSAGTDVSYETLNVKGEFVVQCRQPQDVETYVPFDYSSADTRSLSELSARSLATVRDRALAANAPSGGEYDVILTDAHVETLLSAYLDKANAAMVFPGYSPYKPGLNIHSANVKGEKLSINVFSREPFSEDGIPMPERELLKDGCVCGIYGPTRFCRYLGLEPTGSYGCMNVKNGTAAFEALKNRKCIMPVVFSDFQCDALRGTFGGEIRLAYCFDGNGGVSLLTGGSINGSLTDKQDAFVFSKERYESATYSGPKAVLIPGVSVAGA
ncbi:MAG: hypothetical protein IKR85_03880 [Clostridia bacterium]|nr:hypothetical protein [Clostridia bacterium]